MWHIELEPGYLLNLLHWKKVDYRFCVPFFVKERLMRSQTETLQGETETLKPLRRIHTKKSPAHVSKRLLNI